MQESVSAVGLRTDRKSGLTFLNLNGNCKLHTIVDPRRSFLHHIRPAGEPRWDLQEQSGRMAGMSANRTAIGLVAIIAATSGLVLLGVAFLGLFTVVVLLGITPLVCFPLGFGRSFRLIGRAWRNLVDRRAD
jgi:hypothetical protein